MKKFIPAFILSVSILSCTAQKKSATIKHLKFNGEYLLPDKTEFKATRVGGLSSIDYNPTENLFYFISDDRSDSAPARYYTGKVFLSANGIDSLCFVNVVSLRKKNGKTFPNKRQDSLLVPDPEGLRINRKTGELFWTNEGERIVRPSYGILQNPSVNIMRKDGQLLDTLALPANLRVSVLEKGPRRNGTFEGLAFTNDFNTLYVSVEEPLYEDGPRAGIKDSTAWIRFIKYDVKTKQPLAQYAYLLDPVVREPIPRGAFEINGVPDIMAVNDHQLLVTERSFSTGYLTCNVKVYLVDLSDAEDVSKTYSLKAKPPKRFLQKTLLLNMDDLGINIYNIEGATFGPLLPSGKRSLLFAADDNFSGREKTQVLLFEVD